MASRAPRRTNLAALLLDASDWFNDALLERLALRGWPQLSRSQAQTFAELGLGEARPTHLAARIGITRQSMHTLLSELERAALVDLRPDPGDRRAKLVVLTSRGWALIRDAGRVLRELERELADRIGEPAVRDLRRVLEHDWGPRPRIGAPAGQPRSP